MLPCICLAESLNVVKRKKSGTLATGECVTDLFSSKCLDSNRLWAVTNHSVRNIHHIV